MNVKELSEGDYVSYGGKYVFPVEHICWDGTVCPDPKNPRFGLANRIMPDSIEPIPLTPKIMKALGFEDWNGYWKRKFIKKDRGECRIGYHPTCFHLTLRDNINITEIRKERPLYLHELQHLMRIFEIKEELEVTDDMVRYTEGD